MEYSVIQLDICGNTSILMIVLAYTLRGDTKAKMKAENQAFAERLKSLLRDNRMSQEELGRRIGSNGMSVNRWCGGHVFPHALYLEKMAEVFGVTVDHLKFGPKKKLPGIEPAGQFVEVAVALIGSGGVVISSTDSEWMPADWLPGGGSECECVVFRVNDAVKLHTGASEGDTLLICRNLPVNDGDIALAFSGVATVGKVYARGEGYVISGGELPPADIAAADLIGPVMSVVRRLRTA